MMPPHALCYEGLKCQNVESHHVSLSVAWIFNVSHILFGVSLQSFGVKANVCFIRFPTRKDSPCLCTVEGLRPAHMSLHLRLEAVNETKRYSLPALTARNDSH